MKVTRSIVNQKKDNVSTENRTVSKSQNGPLWSAAACCRFAVARLVVRSLFVLIGLFSRTRTAEEQKNRATSRATAKRRRVAALQRRGSSYFETLLHAFAFWQYSRLPFFPSSYIIRRKRFRLV
jgi:hypothetical protein